ncbi:hypothetical protein CEXT_274811 [Caerostris extrusa]|uniref:Uncharacterized protein n=1 Tax=Caerostris extrusa TaxID=172846 RepID=A0AAV4VH91_CAEEX|nr:hypothetical protein CEXT_274811 [Caerostris extrusa]
MNKEQKMDCYNSACESLINRIKEASVNSLGPGENPAFGRARISLFTISLAEGIGRQERSVLQNPRSKLIFDFFKTMLLG